MHKGGFTQKWWKKAGGRMLAGFVVVAGLAACTGEESGNAFTATDAYHLCDEAIKTTSLNAAQVEIPDQAVRETVKVFSFRWRIGDGLKMPDESGAQRNAVVICRVSKEDRGIVHLEIDGETVLLQ